MAERFDIVIVGAGMAGASLAAEVGPRASVLLVEAEDRPGYHTTGRSAAFWSESYGGPSIQPLTTASGTELRALDLLAPRGALTMGRVGQELEIEAFARTYGELGVAVEVLGRDRLVDIVPGLRPGWIGGAWEPSCCDIDVAGLHQHYLSAARKAGVQLRCRVELTGAQRDGGAWRLSFSDGSEVISEVIANAAGAWADAVATMAGARPLGVTPYRRTIAQVVVDPVAPDDLPLVLDIDESFYFKPESGRLWLSPHDETESAPCDAAPEELDVAIAIDRFDNAVDWPIRRLEHRWAGLRSFAPDRLPVFGFAADMPGFFWFAGQGGFGIQTAPAAARTGARLLLRETGGDIDPTPYSASRFV